MSDNPYKAPESDVELAAGENDRCFYVVSPTKFAVLFFATLSAYSVYWFYKNWAEFKRHTGNNIWPIPRGIFAIFFAHSLFSEVQKLLDKKDRKFSWSPDAMATMYVLFAIASRVFDRMAVREIGSPITDVLGLALLPLIYYPLAKAQKAINLSQDDSEGASNSSFTGANFAWIFLGALVWLIVLSGLLIILGIIDA